MDIDQLRQTLRDQRRALSRREQELAAQALAAQIPALETFRQASSIAAYLATNGEIDPLPLMQRAISQGKQCLVPVLDPQREGHLLFVPWTPDTATRSNQYGIAEPAWHRDQCVTNDAIDLVLVPLLGFDNAGNRLGMGGGYYDRSFAFCKNTSVKIRPMLLGLAYEFQNVEALSAQPWDVPLDAIATEQRLYRHTL